MDTRFWGPSGWQFYHLIAYTYPENPDPITRRKYELFFLAMKTVLPCRFCRESTTKFMEDLPLHPALESKRTLTKWIYDLHNKVNDKLRKQCKEDPNVICPPPDPSLEAVDTLYETLLTSPPSAPPGLDFLFCIAVNYPTSPTSDTVQGYFQTFMNLADVYPFKQLRAIVRSHVSQHILYEALLRKEKLLRWWYALAKKLCNATDAATCELTTFRGTLQKYGRYKSGCKRGKTCRNGKKVRDHAKTYKITHNRLLQL